MNKIVRVCALVASVAQLELAEARVVLTAEPSDDLNAVVGKIRALSQDERRTGVEVRLAAGTYRLTKPLAMDEAASGTAEAPLVWCAADPANPPRLVGSVALAEGSLQPVTDSGVLKRLSPAIAARVRTADLSVCGFAWPKPPAAEYHPPLRLPDVYAAGRPLKLATFPREGWSLMTNIVDRGTFYGDDGLENAIRKGRVKRETVHGGTFAFAEEEPTCWQIVPGLIIQSYWCFDWRDTLIPPKSIDRAKRTMTMAYPHMYGIHLGNPSPRRWRALNVLEELREPGDYAIDPEHKRLYLIPPANGSALAVCGRSGALVALDRAHDIVLRDLAFAEGAADGIDVRHGCHVSVLRCRFRYLRGQAVNMHADTRESRIADCVISETGTGGVTVEGGDRKTLTPANNLVENCRITRFSQRKPCYSSAITLRGVGNIARHNELTDGPHMAVGISGNNNIFEYNVVSNVCMASDDASAVYKGRNPSCRGNIYRWNLFQDIGAPMGHGTAAIYFDDGDGGDTVYGCVFRRCGYPGRGRFGSVFCHGGYSNRVENCIFYDCKRALGYAPWSDATWRKSINGAVFQQHLLQEVDITKPPYITAYPELRGFMALQPQATRHNVSENNVLIGCGSATSGDWRTNTTTVVFAQDPGEAAIRQRLPNFKPIPLEKMGLCRPLPQ